MRLVVHLQLNPDFSCWDQNALPSDNSEGTETEEIISNTYVHSITQPACMATPAGL